MKVKVEVNLQPFSVPNYVLVESQPNPREDGFTEPKKFHLRDLEPDTLESLCNKFTEEVFKKAGKNRPPQVFHE